MAVIVENDGQYEEIEMPKPKDYNEMTKEEIIKLIQQAGIVGMGGACFPTHVKLHHHQTKNRLNHSKCSGM